MPSLNELVRERTELSGADVEWLHLLLADWQLLADLSFGDLILWVPMRGDSRFVAVAQMRATTAPTVHHDDVVGLEIRPGQRPQVEAAFKERRIRTERKLYYAHETPVLEQSIPVVRGDAAIAVISRHTNLAAARTPSRLELTYLRTADDLARMVSQGRFPVVGPLGEIEGSPRVGDGLIRLDETGRVTFASPNAQSAFRRLGSAADLVDLHLGDVAAELADVAAPVAEALTVAIGGSSPRQVEVEAAGATVRFRVIPLFDADVHVAALVLCRDVTEVRRRERELISKDATIREIHHRVKNNLQTVAALLRLQGRRLHDAAAREALEEAQRRVASIAVVHETLAHTGEDAVEFDDVAERLTDLVTAGPGHGREIVLRRHGRFGALPPEVATPLSLVLVELLQNAVEHGLGDGGGFIEVSVRRKGDVLEMLVEDDGIGLPADFRIDQPGSGRGLGLHIARTLVQTELNGELSLAPRAATVPRGCVATVRLVLPTGSPSTHVAPA